MAGFNTIVLRWSKSSCVEVLFPLSMYFVQKTSRYIQLRRVYVLVDSRHGIKEGDLSMMERLSEAATPFQVRVRKMNKEM